MIACVRVLIKLNYFRLVPNLFVGVLWSRYRYDLIWIRRQQRRLDEVLIQEGIPVEDPSKPIKSHNRT